MSVRQTLQNEFENSELWLGREKVESTYKRDLKKRIELINWTLDNMNNTSADICKIIEFKMDEILVKIKKLTVSLKSIRYTVS